MGDKCVCSDHRMVGCSLEDTNSLSVNNIETGRFELLLLGCKQGLATSFMEYSV